MKFKDTIIYKYGVKGVLENKEIEREYGGQSCYDEMTLPFKLAINCILVLISAYLIHRMHKKVVPKVNLPKNRSTNAFIFEILMGSISFGILGVQFYYKIVTHSVFFIFNPCHVCTVN